MRMPLKKPKELAEAIYMILLAAAIILLYLLKGLAEAIYTALLAATVSLYLLGCVATAIRKNIKRLTCTASGKQRSLQGKS